MSNFLETDDQYGSGIQLEEYNGKWSLCNARMGDDDKVWKDWCFPIRDRKPTQKSVPWKITLGSSKEEAVETLRHFIALLSTETGAGHDNTDDNIPF